jgi:hypothetical protein
VTAPPTPDRPPTAVAVETFAAPAIEVWRYRLDFANLPEYNPDVSVVERIAEGDPGGTGGVLGPGARYTFRLADASKPGVTHPVELWPVTVVEPTLVAAAMTGASDAYEEFTVRPTGDVGAAGVGDGGVGIGGGDDGGGGCEATLTLWVSLPPGVPDHVAAAVEASGLEQISKELRLMRAVLEDEARQPSTS